MLRFLTLLSMRICTDRTRFVFEHTRITSIVPASVDELSLLPLVERHLTAGTARATCFVLENLSDCCQICNEREINEFLLAMQADDSVDNDFKTFLTFNALLFKSLNNNLN